MGGLERDQVAGTGPSRCQGRRDEPGTSRYDFTCRYVDLRRNAASAKYRRAITQALASAGTGDAFWQLWEARGQGFAWRVGELGPQLQAARL